MYRRFDYVLLIIKINSVYPFNEFTGQFVISQVNLFAKITSIRGP